MEIIPYTEEMLSTWRTGRLRTYICNLAILSGVADGAENQLICASNAVIGRAVLEKKVIAHTLKNEIKKVPSRDKGRVRRLVNSYNTFIEHAFSS